jgi:hypothetical protein
VDAADGDDLPRALADDAGDVLAVGIDVGEYPISQREHGAGESETDREHAPRQHAVEPERADAEPPEPSR